MKAFYFTNLAASDLWELFGLSLFGLINKSQGSDQRMSGSVIEPGSFNDRKIGKLLSEQQSTDSLCLRFPSRWTVYAVPSSTLRSRSCRRRCYTGSMGSSLRCRGEKVQDAIIRWHVRVTLWRRCTCASRCCRCHSANTLSASTSASLLARFLHLYFIKQFFSQFD